MKFLKSFWRTLKEYIHSHRGPASLKKSDILSRYLTSSSQFSQENDRVKHNALMPMKNRPADQFETSVFNTTGLNSNQTKILARKNIMQNLKKGRSIYGTGNTIKEHIDSVGLDTQISEPPKKHVNIVGWPDEKSKQKQLAMELAKSCNLSLFENPLEK